MKKTTLTTNTTFEIAPTDSNRAETINFIDTLCDITLRGRRVLSSLSIFKTGRLKLDRLMSITEVTTIKKSS